MYLYLYLAETVVFLYIGMQVFAIRTYFKVELIIWSLILILLGRAANIFPISFMVNRFRTIKISGRMQFIMWFSGEWSCDDHVMGVIHVLVRCLPVDHVMST